MTESSDISILVPPAYPLQETPEIYHVVKPDNFESSSDLDKQTANKDVLRVQLSLFP